MAHQAKPRPLKLLTEHPSCLASSCPSGLPRATDHPRNPRLPRPLTAHPRLLRLLRLKDTLLLRLLRPLKLKVILPPKHPNPRPHPRPKPLNCSKVKLLYTNSILDEVSARRLLYIFISGNILRPRSWLRFHHLNCVFSEGHTENTSKSRSRAHNFFFRAQMPCRKF